MPDVSVVIGTYNRRRYLKGTIESVREELHGIAHELIIVDGGSTDGTIRWLVRQRDVIAIVQHNRGVWRGRPVERKSWGYFMNLGFRAGSAPVICMLSDDALVVPGAIREGMELFDREREAGRRLGGIAFYWRNWPTEQEYRVGVTWGNRLFVNHGLYSREAMEAVGYVDSAAFSFYHADGDLSLRMWEEGYECIASPHSFVEHYADANVSVRKGNLERQREDWLTYYDRWAHLGEPDSSWRTATHDDRTTTVRRYWGPVLTHPLYRAAAKTWGLGRIVLQRLRSA